LFPELNDIFQFEGMTQVCDGNEFVTNWQELLLRVIWKHISASCCCLNQLQWWLTGIEVVCFPNEKSTQIFCSI
jgi:hypothetical protein